jgi:hypothetical protein
MNADAAMLLQRIDGIVAELEQLRRDVVRLTEVAPAESPADTDTPADLLDQHLVCT